MEWSIHEVARWSGTTSRALRHYGEIGLLYPSRIGSNGYRFYDEDALARLQRILLLKELGLGLPAVAEVLRGRTVHSDALRAHLRWLHEEQERIDRQIAAVESTIDTLERGGQLMAEKMFDGFDHSQYREEVEERWGKDAYATSDAWWRGMSDAGRKGWMLRQQQLGADWTQAAARGTDPDSAEAQALAQRQFDWLRGIPGTPGGRAEGPSKEHFVGLAQLYVTDERFAATYGGTAGATFVRDAMVVFADRNL